MSQQLPMFPLNTVVFPGMRVPLNVFEKRYRALVRHLLAEDMPRNRLLGTVAIRAGYEVGEHGAQAVHTTGVLLQMTECTPHSDGGFEIEVLARQRMQLLQMGTTDGFPSGEVELLEDDEPDLADADEEAHRALETFEQYRGRLAEMRGEIVRSGSFGSDPSFLSYALSATALLPMHHRQSLLEAETAADRLRLLRTYLTDEMRSMRALPSLPATEIARSGWSPN
ncbi:LON peptidase substrate-binding domain-containing protein [Nocardioidaceae bacterium]|nr:LON peptidase substrate-binding domain-containing protein [Nocardioidaceae bacterium]